MSTPKTEAKRAKAALVLSKKLAAASQAMTQFIRACTDDGDRTPYADDGRVTLRKQMDEYSNYTQDIHDRYQRKNGH